MKIIYVGQSIENIENRTIKKERGEVMHFTAKQIKEFSHIFRFLNNKDKDILFLIFVAQKKQSAVQQILDRSQPSLAYDIQRIRKRLQFICYLNNVIDIFVDFLDTVCCRNTELYTKNELDILIAMFYTTSLTQASYVLGEPQIKIRYRFDKIIDKLELLKQWEILEIFNAIRGNLNIIKRVYKE